MITRTLVHRAVAAAALALAAAASHAAPTLIGDTISILRAYPDTGTQYGNAIPDLTGAAGTSDVVGWSFGSHAVSVQFDAEADTLRFDFLTLTSYVTSVTEFDGYVISGIDADVIGVNLASNSTAYGVGLAFSQHGFNIALSGTSAPGSILVHLDLADSTAAVPEPASAALVVLALGVMGAGTRRRQPGVKP